MSAVFENKVAGVDEIDDRLDTISRAIRAFVDCWEPRVDGLHYLKDQDLAAFDAGRPVAAGRADRAFIEAFYDAMIEQVRGEGKRHRRALDRLEQFYIGEDIDLEESTRH